MRDIEHFITRHHVSELNQLDSILVDLDEAITYHEEKGLAYLPYYTSLLKRRAIIRKAIKKMRRIKNDD